MGAMKTQAEGHQVLKKTLRVHPEDDKTNIRVDFDLAEDFNSLVFECSYSPKTIADPELAHQAVLASIGRYVPRWQLPLYEGHLQKVVHLVNHLTFSLDYENTYLGCAHRHPARQTHVISAEKSSPGFLRFQPRRGRYRVAINVHSITSPEVIYELTVTAFKGVRV